MYTWIFNIQPAITITVFFKCGLQGVQSLNQYILPVGLGFFWYCPTVIALMLTKFGSSESQTSAEYIEQISTYFWWRENPPFCIIPGKPQLSTVTTQLVLFQNSWRLTTVSLKSEKPIHQNTMISSRKCWVHWTVPHYFLDQILES